MLKGQSPGQKWLKRSHCEKYEVGRGSVRWGGEVFEGYGEVDPHPWWAGRKMVQPL